MKKGVKFNGDLSESTTKIEIFTVELRQINVVRFNLHVMVASDAFFCIIQTFKPEGYVSSSFAKFYTSGQMFGAWLQETRSLSSLTRSLGNDWICVTSGLKSSNSEESKLLFVISVLAKHRSPCSENTMGVLTHSLCIAVLYYAAFSGTSAQLQTSLVCEGKTLTIECPSGTTIDVEDALYGRDRGPSVCNHRSIRVTSGCKASTSLSRVRDACQGETSCQISASNRVFGDPCGVPISFCELSTNVEAFAEPESANPVI
ncbi:putative L-rhamnose-binding lectin CSL3 [Apostichopus japonicus]|uniref:Putative L-rhamnose-binding lectin CSL3 n=1 Tax=Stichopus japonicus TaxID=307972 RepID=A0A2G8LA94_STIJA|nr:putative L-rhamnose-binding lectin CSL3 [Apostichopus japonicus]